MRGPAESSRGDTAQPRENDAFSLVATSQKKRISTSTMWKRTNAEKGRSRLKVHEVTAGNMS